MASLAALLIRRSRLVLAVAAAGVVALAVYGLGAFGELRLPKFEDPSSESVRMAETARDAAGYDVAPGLLVLARADGSVRAPAAAREIERLAREARREPGVARVRTPAQDPALVARDGRSALIAVHFSTTSEDAVREPLEALRADLRSDALELEFGGPAAGFVDIAEIVESDLKRAELLAFPLLTLLLIIVFRGLVAAALPLALGVVAVFASLAGLRALNELVPVSITSVNLVTSLGLGLAVDYSLFLVSRYREALDEHGPGQAALEETLCTAGRTVVFSALTVAAALAALCLFPQRFLYSMGLGGAFVSLFAAAAALVVVGGLLALLGPRVNALGLKRRPPVASEGRWYRFAHLVQRRPIGFATGAAGVLLALGAAGLGLQTTAIDASVLPAEEEASMVDRAIAERFAALDAGVLVAVEARDSARGERAVARMRADVADLPGTASVLPPQRLDERTVLLQALPEHAPFDARASEHVEAVRGLRGEAPPFLVGGPAAGLVDFRASVFDHLPQVLVLLVGTTLVLLFQAGRLEGPLGYEGQGAIELGSLLLVAALAFGLSTDYGVFLLSRIKELRDGGLGDAEAIAQATQRTAGLITAAAALFVVAIGALATSRLIFLKETGLGTAFAVLIDATLIRVVLVPSLMRLLGRANWWAPRPLRWVHRRLPAVD